MVLWRWDLCSVMEALINRDVVPSHDVVRVQMVDHGKRIELVQAGYNSPVFDFRQPADVQYEFGTPPARCQLVARALHFSIGQSESRAGLPQTKTRMHVYPNREMTASHRIITALPSC